MNIGTMLPIQRDKIFYPDCSKTRQVIPLRTILLETTGLLRDFIETETMPHFLKCWFFICMQWGSMKTRMCSIRLLIRVYVERSRTLLNDVQIILKTVNVRDKCRIILEWDLTGPWTNREEPRTKNFDFCWDFQKHTRKWWSAHMCALSYSLVNIDLLCLKNLRSNVLHNAANNWLRLQRLVDSQNTSLCLELEKGLDVGGRRVLLFAEARATHSGHEAPLLREPILVSTPSKPALNLPCCVLC